MQRASQGFTLIETVIATGILAVGSVAIASLFVNSFKVNMSLRQRTAAIELLSGKLEQLRDVSSGNGEFFEYVTIASDGSVQHSATDDSLPYLRFWQVSGTELKVVTVIVYGNHPFQKGPVELTRATLKTGPRW